MDQEIRNKLRNVVTQCRKLLEDSVSQELEGKYGIFARKDQVTADPNATMTHLTDEEQAARKDILDHFDHIKARGFKPKDALDQLVREIAFTHLNRLCAYKMMEAREVYVGGQKFREAVSRGIKSNGFLLYLGTDGHEADERLYSTGQQEVAYRHFLDWLGGLLSDEIGVLFNPNDPANRLHPEQKTLDAVLDLINNGGIKPEEKDLRQAWPEIWSQDETIGWVYQYFTPKELRDQARKESAAPRNSYELAFRNQFFTPRYVVEFLTDNTLGRIWYEMRKGDTKLKAQCQYWVRRPTEIFLKEAEQSPKKTGEGRDGLSPDELLSLPVYIPYRPKKDPRDLKILDPACGSGHFLLYCFDLLLVIYEEAYADADLGSALQKDYPKLEDLRRDVPRLILAHNLHGIDIDLRASQIAALALWLRCQRAYQETGLKKDRPKITRSNFVCAEPMPGEAQMLREFIGQIQPRLLGQLVEVVFEKMKVAGEAGSLLKIDDEIRDAVAEARTHWLAGPISVQQRLFDDNTPAVQQRFDFSGITDGQFFEQAEAKVVDALRCYAETAQNGPRFQRRLFTEDAVRGFAFADILHKRFDVLLLNPPFGEPPEGVRGYIVKNFPAGRNDIYAAMIVRCLELLLGATSYLGAITSRAFLVGRDLRAYRKQLLASGKPNIGLLWDLGAGVLDGATVETAAYVVTAPIEDTLLHRGFRGAKSERDSSWKWATEPLDKFRRLPDAQFVFGEAGDYLIAAPDSSCSFIDAADVTTGLSTECDERFVRLVWEVDPREIGYTWFRFSKGGDYSWWTSDIHLVINRRNNGEELAAYAATNSGNIARTRQSSKFYGHAAATFSRRSQKGFSVRRLREGCCFADKSGVIIPRTDPAKWVPIIPIILASQKYIRLIESQVKFGSYESGIIKRLPWPLDFGSEIGETASEVYRLMDSIDSADETAALFVSPLNAGASCSERMERAVELVRQVLHTVHLTLDSDVQRHLLKIGKEKDAVLAGPLPIVSYSVGAAFGRWDVRVAATCPVDRNDPFSTLPVRPPGMLSDDDRARITAAQEGYPIRIASMGIMVDDPEHQDDIVGHVRQVLDTRWKAQADSLEKATCNCAGVDDIREYFRKTGKGGFWNGHIGRYSKSRRNAPIYWLLQSAKGNYGLWLYYPRFDKDLLFKALVNYVEPKLRLENSRLETLRGQKAALGDSGKEAKRIAKDVERQEDFNSELQDFEDKLRRAANLHLEPDLNDGVVLNTAPLHELVPWSEAERYWEELLEGKYEWSSIEKQLRQKGLVK